MEYGVGCYGAIWYRSTDRRYWECDNSDYYWRSVVDDFGNLIPVTEYINQRGY